MEHTFLGRLNSAIYRVLKEVLIVIGFVLISLVFISVVLRYIFNLSILWAYELSVLLFVWSAFLGAAAGARTKNHVSFTLLIDRFPLSAKKYVVLLKDLMIILFLAMGTYFGYKVLGRTMRQYMQTINIPVGLIYMALPVGLIPMLLFYLQDLIENFTAKPTSASKEE